MMCSVFLFIQIVGTMNPNISPNDGLIQRS